MFFASNSSPIAILSPLSEKRLFLMGAASMILGMHRKKPFHYRSTGNPVKQGIWNRRIGMLRLIMWQRSFRVVLVVLSIVLAGCATVDETPKKNLQLGLITTPPTYYTTQRARYLGETYKNHLDRLVERIVRSPKTANLQFANNIASVGGIGFFTHSATGSVDARFLEVVMGVPETFDPNSDHNAKVSRVFSLYGAELLSILASDQEIYQEKELNGYGLNLSWRNIVTESNGSRIALERTVLYFSKAKVRSFLTGDLTQNTLLGEAVIFAVIEDGPMKLVSFRPQELKPDLRLPIQEQTLAIEKGSSNPGPKSEGLVAIPLAARPSVSTQGLEKVPRESAPSLVDKPVEFTTSSPFGESPKDPGTTSTPSVRRIEVPVFSTSGPIESAEPKESLVNQKVEAVFRNQEAAEPSSQLASLEQEKTETRSILPKSSLAPATMPVVAPSVGSSVDKSLGETSEKMQDKDLVNRPFPQVLQGFIIQIAFADRGEAQLWAETLERRGYAVSMTEAAGGAVRLRVGSFTVRDEAERQLQALRQDGLKGIVISLPQAYRPEARPTRAVENGKTVSVVQ